MNLHAGEWLVLALMICMVIYSLWEANKGKQAVLNGHKTKLTYYKETMAFLWLPTLALLALVATSVVSASTLGLTWQNSWANWAGGTLVAAVLAFGVWNVRQLTPGTDQFQQLSDAMETHKWLMPHSKQELRWFTGGVSVSAGVCEELLFRGFILAIFTPTIGIVSSLLLGSILFGLCHIYQGWANVLRTGILGMLLGIIYLLSNSLWVVIVLHSLIDIYGGVLGYLLQRQRAEA